MGLPGIDSSPERRPSPADDGTDGSAESATTDGSAESAGTATTATTDGTADRRAGTIAPSTVPRIDCDLDADRCTYPGLGRNVSSIRHRPPRTIDYVDVTGSLRSIRIQVRHPEQSDGPLPVVIWSHGGSEGRRNPARIGIGWSDVLVRAGYLVIVVAHPARALADHRRLCQALEATDCTFPSLVWDRPADVSAVLDWLHSEAPGPLRSLADLDRIAHAGHSAGGSAALALAGTRRDLAGIDQLVDEPRVRATVASSGPAIGRTGLDGSSFLTVDRPVLSLSGIGDDSGGTDSEARGLVGRSLPHPWGHSGWFDDHTATHATFNLDARPCRRRAEDPTVCERHHAVLTSAVVAFLDLHLRKDESAATYLRSGRLEALSEGSFTLTMP